MPRDRIVELTLVVRLDRHLDEDAELLIRDYLTSEGLLEVQELTRVGLTGTIDLPRIWEAGATNRELEELDQRARLIPPPKAPPPPPPPERDPTPLPGRWPWQKKR